MKSRRWGLINTSREHSIQKFLQLLNRAQSGFVHVDHPSWMINPRPNYLKNFSVRLSLDKAQSPTVLQLVVQ
jgi:hypothetical protein